MGIQELSEDELMNVAGGVGSFGSDVDSICRRYLKNARAYARDNRLTDYVDLIDELTEDIKAGNFAIAKQKCGDTMSSIKGDTKLRPIYAGLYGMFTSLE